MVMRSPLSGEPIRMARPSAPTGVDVDAILGELSVMRARLDAAEQRERDTVKEMSGYVLQSMQLAAATAAVAKTSAAAPVVENENNEAAEEQQENEQITRLQSAVDALRAVTERLSVTIEQRKTDPQPMSAQSFDASQIAQIIRSELSQPSSPGSSLKVVIGARDANGMIKEFFINKGAQS